MSKSKELSWFIVRFHCCYWFAWKMLLVFFYCAVSHVIWGTNKKIQQGRWMMWHAAIWIMWKARNDGIFNNITKGVEETGRFFQLLYLL